MEERTRAGEPTAAGEVESPRLEVVFREHFARLVRLLSVISPEATDAVQEAFLEAHRRWPAVSRYGDPAAWIRHVALNKLRDRLRAQQRRERLLARLRLVRRLPQEESLHDAAGSIAALPPRQRMAMVLFYLADLPVAEVAREMGISEGTVKAALHAGRENLRRLVEVDDG